MFDLDEQPKPLGIQYSPFPSDDKPALPVQPKLTFTQLRFTYKIKFIRFLWVDPINIVRYRVIPVAHFAKILDSPRPGISMVSSTLGMVVTLLAEGFSPCGEYLYVPDLDTLRLCPYAPDTASVMGWFEEKVPSPNVDKSLAFKLDLCPRTLLRRTVEEAKSINGLHFLVGFETEFILLKSTSPIQPVDHSGWSVSSSLASGSVQAKVLEEIADALISSGIELHMFHAEGARGQYEVVTGPLPPLEAADALVHTRETIYNIASKHGLRATLAPRLFSDNCGNAAHAHISVHTKQTPPPSSQSPNLNEVEATFLAGLLTHLPALVALNLPIPASYKRMVDGAWSGGTYVSWGTDCREAPIRLCNASSPSSRNFEFRTLDGTANPYIALSGILAAGYAGVKEQYTLQVKDCAGDLTPAQLGEEGRKVLGIMQRLPLSWQEAREKLQADAVIRGFLGENFVKKFLSVQKTSADHLTSRTEEENTKLLVNTY